MAPGTTHAISPHPGRLLLQSITFDAGCEMHIELVDSQVHRHRVVHPDLHASLITFYTDVFATGRDVSVLDFAVDDVLDLVIGAVVHHGEARFGLHLVLELIIGEVDGHNLCADIDARADDEQPDDGSEPGAAPRSHAGAAPRKSA